MNYSGEQTLTQAIDFKGKTYTASALVKSELDIQYFRLGWINQFVNLLEEKVKFGPIIELIGYRILDIKAADDPNFVRLKNCRAIFRRNFKILAILGKILHYLPKRGGINEIHFFLAVLRIIFI